MWLNIRTLNMIKRTFKTSIVSQVVLLIPYAREVWKFNGHVDRIDNNRLTKKLFNTINSQNTWITWLEGTKDEGFQKINIQENNIRNCEVFRTLVTKHKFPEKAHKNSKSNTVNSRRWIRWMEEESEAIKISDQVN